MGPPPLEPEAELRRYIRDIQDFPKPGILFRDLTPLLANHAALELAIQVLAAPFTEARIDYVVGTEARGFIFGAPIAMALGVGFVPVRKPGKLPGETVSASYELEYGTDHVEMHVDAVSAGDRVLVVDDLIATGGTAQATVELVRRAGATVAGCAFLIELTFLEGRKLLDVEPFHSVIRY
ncbi:MAG: adenine phosphoribosyltransferase [Myxococcota bacterium]|nr:adenine phosphoribosyltransferase [Myxococcota bacterium]